MAMRIFCMGLGVRVPVLTANKKYIYIASLKNELNANIYLNELLLKSIFSTI